MADLRAAIYCRISSDREELQLGVRRQEKDCRALCETQGWSIIDTYIDNDISAADPRRARPEYERMINDIRLGRVDVVVVWAEDRLHRQPVELERFVQVCEDAGMAMLASPRGGITKLADADALMLLRFKGSMAAREVAKIRERVQRKKLELAERGLPSGGGKRAFGWERDGLTVRESEATLIREAADRVLMGETLTRIAKDWNDRHVPTVTGARWRINNLKSPLTNPRNAGLRQYKDKANVVGPAAWPAILDRETFDRLQLVFSANAAQRPVTAPRGYPLRGVLVCAVCQRRLTTKTVRRTPDVPRERYYACRKDTGGCGTVAVTAVLVEQAIVPMILGLVDQPGVRQLTRNQRQAETDELRELVYENAQDERRIADLEDAFAGGDLSRAGLQRNAKAIRDRIEQRHARMATLQGASTLDRFRGRISDHWNELTADEQRLVISGLLKSVDVKKATKLGFNGFDPSRLEFHWRYAALASWSAAYETSLTDEQRQAKDLDERRWRREGFEALTPPINDKQDTPAL